MAKKITEEFNDQKFDELYDIEDTIIDNLDQVFEWHDKWSENVAKFKAENNATGVQNSLEMVEWWEGRAVRVIAEMAEYKAELEASKDPICVEFVQKKLTMLAPVYEALAKLKDSEIKDGKKIMAALEPLMEYELVEVKPEPDPLGKGNPFKKGSSPKSP